jgi:hypothetical protein
MPPDNEPRLPPPSAPPSTLPPRASKGRWLLFGCGGLLALLLLIVATVAVTIWWIQRPIKPVVLSPREKVEVDQKMQRLQQGSVAAAPVAPESKSGNTTNSGRQPAPSWPGHEIQSELPQRFYMPGGKVLQLTEREINGLLNQNTDLGKSVRLEFDQDAINAYLAVRIPQDFPIGGGKMFRARGRFRVSLGNGGKPYAILEDVTVFGVSLPKAWLGGIKGENLLGEAMTGNDQAPVLKGIKSLRVEPGVLILELED